MLFDTHFGQSHLSNMGNPLEAITKVVDFEMFRPILESKLLDKFLKNNAGARPFGPILMFKIMMPQRYYGLGDKQIEYPSRLKFSAAKFNEFYQKMSFFYWMNFQL